ncbi:MAG TPA: glycosyltransferase family 39 protein [Vicinamibacteria bacterium]|nr:glycosyltransferase family 39 protein [Vicinamibacteria bacterium]
MNQTSETPLPVPRATVLAALWAAGVLVRLAFIGLEPATAPVADETMWLMALTRIPAAHFSPFANYPIFHPPLYPYFLAGANALFGSLVAVKVLQALVGSLIIPAVFRIGLRLFGSRTAAGAAALAAFYPELIWFSAHFWCETLFLAFLWWAIERVIAADDASSIRSAAGAGVLFGLAVLTRETVLYLLPLAALWLARPRSGRRIALPAALLAAAFAVVSPWTARNWIQFDAFIPVSTGGGLNLYQGNAPISRGEVYNEYYANEGKVEQYRWARTAGIEVILSRQPGWIFEKIRDEGPKLAELDSLALIHLRRRAYAEPSCGVYRGVAAIVILPWMLIALGSILALSRAPVDRRTVLLTGLLAGYLLLHIATQGFSRYRLPVVPGFMILAAALLDLDPRGGAAPARRALLATLLIALALLLAPSALDQLGHLGLAAPPGYEGFAPVCRA